MDKIKGIGPDQIQMHAERIEQRQKEFLGRVKLQPGQSVYYADLKTGLVHNATVNRFVVIQNGRPVKKREVVILPGCIYAVALNKKML